MAEDVDVGIGDGHDHAPGHLVGGHLQLGVHGGDDDVEACQHLVGVVEGAVLEDVDLDTTEDTEWAQQLVQALDLDALLVEPLLGQAVGDGQARRMVGEDDVLVSEIDGRAGHVLDRGATVGPRAVEMAVAPEAGPELGALADLEAGRRLEFREVPRFRSVAERLGDDGAGARSDAVEFGDAAGCEMTVELVVAEAFDHRQGGAERPHLRSGSERSVEVVDRPTQRSGRGVHGSGRRHRRSS